MERFKHQVSGGWWKDSDGNYIQAGSSVCTFLHTNPELQKHLGWTNHIAKPVGKPHLLL